MGAWALIWQAQRLMQMFMLSHSSPEPVSEIVEFGRIGKALAKTEFAFEHALGTGETAAGQLCRGNTAFGRFAEMEPLDHCAFLTARELDQAAGI